MTHSIRKYTARILNNALRFHRYEFSPEKTFLTINLDFTAMSDEFRYHLYMTELAGALPAFTLNKGEYILEFAPLFVGCIIIRRNPNHA